MLSPKLADGELLMEVVAVQSALSHITSELKAYSADNYTTVTAVTHGGSNAHQ